LTTIPPQNSTSRFSVYYGWYILFGCFLLLFFQAGARFSFGVMFKPMLADFGWDRASISLAFFLNMTFFALTMSLPAGFMIVMAPSGLSSFQPFFLPQATAALPLSTACWNFRFTTASLQPSARAAHRFH